ncbi:MAG: HypC/HybG/HupF family hydrogenase formation chaperone [Candidatus Latescibacterota bacterium]|nr:MAG: HypC/HybG/HupF family hydrogenase formation chaperone [Candidatus Latescibacterota bacterium]
MCLAIPGKIIDIRGDEPMMRTGIVDFGGVRKEVNLSFVPGVATGDYVLVHAGFALNTVDAGEAKRALDLLKQLGKLDDDKRNGP